MAGNQLMGCMWVLCPSNLDGRDLEMRVEEAGAYVDVVVMW